MSQLPATYYLDSSALVKAYVDEPGSDWVASVVSDGSCVISSLTVAELASALARRTREGRVTAAVARSTFETFVADVGLFQVVHATQELIRSAAASMLDARLPALRAADAIQLATAIQSSILLRQSTDEQLVFVVADRRLREAASAAGLTVENPEDHA